MNARKFSRGYRTLKEIQLPANCKPAAESKRKFRAHRKSKEQRLAAERKAWRNALGLAVLKGKGRDPVRYCPPDMRLLVLQRDGFQCRYCGADLTRQCARIDHVLPWHKKGPTHPHNLVAACDDCNHKKFSPCKIAIALAKARSPEECEAIMWTVPNLPFPDKTNHRQASSRLAVASNRSINSATSPAD